MFPKKERKVPISVRIPIEIKDQLYNIADKYQTRPSEIVIHALKQTLSKLEKEHAN